MPRALARGLSAPLLAALASLAPLSAAAELRWQPAGAPLPHALADLPFSPRAEFNGFAPAPEHLPLTLRLIGPVPEGVQRAEVIGALEAAARTWNAVGCAQVAFEPEVLAEAEGSEAPAVEVSFAPGIGPNASRIAWTTYPAHPDERASVTLNTSSVVWRSAPDPFQRFAEPERPAVDLQAVITHELGHVLGLSHTQAHNAAAMSAAYLRDGRQRVLSADDKLGLCALFPTEGYECTRDAECPGPERCVEGVCDPLRGRLGDYCAFDLMHCPEFCLIDDTPTGTGYCSEHCEQEDRCPTHFACAPPADGELAACVFAPAPDPNASSGGCSQSGAPASSLPLVLLVLGGVGLSLRSRSRR